jgi:hypothetical protein
VKKAGLYFVPAFLINLENLQTVPPGLGSATEDAGQFLNLSFVVPGGNIVCNFSTLDESASGDHVLAHICVKQGQVSRPLKTVLCHEGVLEIYGLLIGHGETAPLLLLLVNGELLSFLI